MRLFLCGTAQTDQPSVHTAYRAGLPVCRETAEAPVCRRVPDEGEPLQLPDAQRGGTRRNVLHERFDLP